MGSCLRKLILLHKFFLTPKFKNAKKIKEIRKGHHSIVNQCYVKYFDGYLYVAQKIPKSSHLTDQVYDLFINEINIYKLLNNKQTNLSVTNHPNICRYYNSSSCRTSVELLLEYAPDGEVFDLVEKSSLLSIVMINKILIQLLLSLKFLHKGTPCIMNRDIKLENILISGDKIVLADFGLSKVDICDNFEKLGTKGYIAPEIYTGKGYNHMCDYYSLGVCLFALLTKHLLEHKPSSKITKNEYINLVNDLRQKSFESTPVTQPELVPKYLYTLLVNLLEVNPKKRWNWRKSLQFLSNHLDFYPLLKDVYSAEDINAILRSIGKRKNDSFTTQMYRLIQYYY